MNKPLITAFLLLLLFVWAGSSESGEKKPDSTSSVTWDVDNLEFIGGHKVEVLGSPKVIETDKGKAIEFDGVGDGLIVDKLPLAGAEKFTLEIVFRPDPNGLDAQRFLHLQEDGTKHRILIETRMPEKDKWYLDTFINCATCKKTLVEPANTHSAGQWYNAALVYDGEEIRHYINGVKEMSAKIKFSPFNEGKTSIGVRLNKVYWFKGAIRKVRFTPAVLEPQEFLRL